MLLEFHRRRHHVRLADDRRSGTIRDKFLTHAAVLRSSTVNALQVKFISKVAPLMFLLPPV
jgi:hypothetical protein